MALLDRYGFDLDLSEKIYQMSVSQKQTVEIVKMLSRGAKIPDPGRAYGGADASGGGQAF